MADEREHLGGASGEQFALTMGGRQLHERGVHSSADGDRLCVHGIAQLGVVLGGEATDLGVRVSEGGACARELLPLDVRRRRLLRRGQSALGLGHRLGVAAAQPLALSLGQRLASFFDAAVGERQPTLTIVDRLYQFAAALPQAGQLIGRVHAVSLARRARRATLASDTPWGGARSQ